jgi:hypothetical protein
MASKLKNQPIPEREMAFASVELISAKRVPKEKVGFRELLTGF